MDKKTANRLSLAVITYSIMVLISSISIAQFIKTSEQRTDYIVTYEGVPYPVLETLTNDGETIPIPSLQLVDTETELFIPEGKDLNIATVQIATDATRLQVFLAEYWQPSATAESLKDLFFEAGGTGEQWEEFQLEKINQDFNQRITENYNQAKQQLQTSTAAAYSAVLQHLGEEINFNIRIAGVMENTPAEEAGLLAGDLITAVNGESQSITSLADYLQTIPNTTLTYTVEREGETFDVDVTASPNPAVGGKRLIGIFGSDEYETPGEISFAYGEVGGASAGIVFAVGIYEMLTEEEILADGVKYGGTGSITPSGQILEIDGLKQKIAAADNTEHDYFFFPKMLCEETEQLKTSHVRIIPVETFEETLTYLEHIKAGDTDKLPSCSQ